MQNDWMFLEWMNKLNNLHFYLKQEQISATGVRKINLTQKENKFIFLTSLADLRK